MTALTDRLTLYECVKLLSDPIFRCTTNYQYGEAKRELLP